MAWFGDVVSLPFGVAPDASQVPVTRGYRHVIAWGVAIVLHLILLALVAGVSLPKAPAPESSQSLDVVLVSRPAATPERATAIAEASQQAASADTQSERTAATPSEAAPDTTPEPSPEPSPEPTSKESRSEQAPVQAPTPESSGVAEPVSEPKTSPSRSARELAASATASVRERDFTMSAPSTELADREQQAAREAAEARYVDGWTRRVQDYGNRFYSAPSDLDGQLKVRVVIDHRGRLLQAEVVQSSGHPELDQAALDTIRGAAPYRPFDSGMAGLDRLSISRIWRFGTGNDFGVR
ncbi:protein TonB [Onishia taeanensis]|uniref:Protein TonB n=1 Tax=Onishia taeanensis TaxID=284577 RepID=A0A1G7RZS7_9GAMM|nr:TonB family protein [Halomonas taeanensis]SDG16285.1 protein TonB [Halomonas taeanensis]